MRKNNLLNLNIHMLIFLIIACIAFINDIFIYIFKIDYELSICISAFLIILSFTFFIKKKKILIENDFNKLDLLIFVFYLILFLVFLLRIDDFIDSVSYHLYCQKNTFIDKINFDFLPNSVFFFPLGDRIYYIFTKLLGYRFGTILSLYTIVILYYQLKRLFKCIFINITNKRAIFWSSLICLSISVNMVIFQYFIDNFSLIILLEIFYVLVKDINVFENKNYLYFITLLAGISVGVKITNIVLAFILIMFILINNIKLNGLKEIKKIKIYDYILLIILFVLPFFIYMIDNYTQTKNPIFPFYNNIIKSPYLKEINGKDERLGSNNLLEFLLWPIIIVFDPIRGDDINGVVDPIWGIGYIISIYLIIFNKNKKISQISLLNMIMTLFWTKFQSGYVRYGMIIAFTYYFVVIYVLEKLLNRVRKADYNKKISFLVSIIKPWLIIVCIFFSVSYGILNLCCRAKDCLELYCKCKKIDINENFNNKVDIDGIWLETKYNTFYISEIREDDDPMYNLDILIDNDPMTKINNIYSELTKEMLLNKIKGKNLYSIIPTKYQNYYNEVLDKAGYKVEKNLGIYMNYRILSNYNFLQIVKIISK